MDQRAILIIDFSYNLNFINFTDCKKLEFKNKKTVSKDA